MDVIQFVFETPREKMLPTLALSPQDRWLAACGTRPTLARWKNMRGRHKFSLLHSVAMQADDEENGNYLTAYEQIDIDDIGLRRSVEHVLPRSRAGANGKAKNDPNGWAVATQRANSSRGNLPLVLWDGEAEGHFSPPMEQRARLARKWLFLRATYSGLDPPSVEQLRNLTAIFEMAKEPPGRAEARVNEIYRRELGWSNPLIPNPRWLDDPGWRQMVERGEGPL